MWKKYLTYAIRWKKIHAMYCLPGKRTKNIHTGRFWIELVYVIGVFEH